MHEHLQGVNGFRCGNKQNVTLSSAETDVRCPVLWNGEMGYLSAILIEYRHAGSSIVIPSDPMEANT